LILAFGQHAVTRYVKNGVPTSEIKSFRTALRPVRRLYGHEPVTNFGPLALIYPMLERMKVAEIIDRHVPADPQAEYSYGTVLSLLAVACFTARWLWWRRQLGRG
jgi:hypothetical protein